jgi:hypothetical protein
MRNLKFSLKILHLLCRYKSESRDIEEAHKEGIRGIWCKTKFEFVIFNSGVTTKIKSGDFKYNKEATYSIPVFQIMKEMKNINY